MSRPKVPVGAPRVDDGVEDHRDRLVALRDRLEAAIAESAHRDLAPLAARYQSVLSELAALPTVKGADGIDDIAQARANRRASAAAG
jgi:hypothetical protein